MFASTYPNRNSAQGHRGGIYQQMGVEIQVAGASPHGLVAMLFDGLMESLAQARGAIRSNDRAGKGMAISRAVRIVEEGLRSSLNTGAGGKLARDLDELYTYVCVRLTQANLRSDEGALDECQRLMQPLREAWLAIADQTHSGALR